MVNLMHYLDPTKCDKKELEVKDKNEIHRAVVSNGRKFAKVSTFDPSSVTGKNMFRAGRST